MLPKILFIIGLCIAYTNAEAPLRRAPYPAAGWRPRIPFNLPGKYGPPKETELDQQQNTTPQANVEITEERLDFVGQFDDNSFLTTTELTSSYLPPADSEGELLDEQELPTATPQPQFNDRPTRRRGLRKDKRIDQRYPVTTTQQPIQVEETDFDQQDSDQEQFIPADQSYQPETPPQPQPASEYGAPFNNNNNINDNGDQENNQNGADNQDDIAEQNRSAIEALNAALDAYNRARARQSGLIPVVVEEEEEEATATTTAATADEVENENFGEPTNGYPSSPYTQGQYYILAPDNTVQRVRFVTGRDQQDLQSNGFSAKLKYRPAGMLRDPIYRYNSNGQLIRLIRK